MLKARSKIVNIRSAKDTIVLKIYGDVHWGASGCDRERFNRLLESDTPNSYYLSVGDDLNLIPHDDKRFRSVEMDRGLMDRACDKSFIDAEVEWYIETWKKAKIPHERHLGVLEGNHSLKQTSWGMNPIIHFCDVLKFPYLAEYSAVVPISFRFPPSLKTRELIVKCHHGWGGTNSRQMGADLNKFILDSKQYDGWDISVYGHTHNFFAVPVPILDCRSRIDWVEQRIGIVGVCGTFLKTLEKGPKSSYSERGGMPARVLSWLEIEVGFKMDHDSNISFRYPRQLPI